MAETISQITDLGKIQMIAGDSQTFDIEILPDDESVEKSMVGYGCYFQLSPIGQEDILVFNRLCELKQGSITTFFITLSNADTDDLFGSFTLKIVLVDPLGRKLKKARGTFNILKDEDGVV